MAKFFIESEAFLGCHCNGSEEYASGEGYIELTDEQVNNLVKLIRDNDGETDIEELELEDKYPDIYEILDDAYRDIAREAEYTHWLIEGYQNGYFDRPEDMMQKCEKEGLFKFEPDLAVIREEEGLEEDEEVDERYWQDEKEEAFNEWLRGYVNSLSEKELVSFIEDHYGDDLIDMECSDTEYQVLIPQEIVDMANED